MGESQEGSCLQAGEIPAKAGGSNGGEKPLLFHDSCCSEMDERVLKDGWSDEDAV